jgi:hypothetical protein
MIIVHPADKGYCSQCRYVIGLKAKTKAFLTVTIFSEAVPVSLQTAKTVQDFIEKDHMMKYHYLSRNSSFEITILIYSGEVMAYVNLGLNVTKEINMKILSQKNKDERVINEVITYDDKNNKFNNLLGSKFFSILVFGLNNSNYSITVRPVEHYEKKLLYGVLDYTVLKPREARNYSFLFSKQDVYIGET